MTLKFMKFKLIIFKKQTSWTTPFNIISLILFIRMAIPPYFFFVFEKYFIAWTSLRFASFKSFSIIAKFTDFSFFSTLYKVIIYMIMTLNNIMIELQTFSPTIILALVIVRNLFGKIWLMSRLRVNLKVGLNCF